MIETFNRAVSIFAVVVAFVGFIFTALYWFSAPKQLKIRRGKKTFDKLVEKLTKNGKGSVMRFLQELSEENLEALHFWLERRIPGFYGEEIDQEYENMAKLVWDSSAILRQRVVGKGGKVK